MTFGKLHSSPQLFLFGGYLNTKTFHESPTTSQEFLTRTPRKSGHFTAVLTCAYAIKSWSQVFARTHRRAITHPARMRRSFITAFEQAPPRREGFGGPGAAAAEVALAQPQALKFHPPLVFPPDYLRLAWRSEVVGGSKALPEVRLHRRRDFGNRPPAPHPIIEPRRFSLLCPRRFRLL
jgi:hypothetical protein